MEPRQMDTAKDFSRFLLNPKTSQIRKEQQTFTQQYLHNRHSLTFNHKLMS